MAENKTQKTKQRIEDYIAKIEDGQKKDDCIQLIKLIEKLQNQKLQCGEKI